MKRDARVALSKYRCQACQCTAGFAGSSKGAGNRNLHSAASGARAEAAPGLQLFPSRPTQHTAASPTDSPNSLEQI